MDRSEAIEQRVRDAAREWHVRMHSGEVEASTRAEFETWLHAHRDHKRAYRAFEQLYRDLEFALPEAGVDVDALLGRTKNPWTERLWAFVPGPQWGAGLAAAAALLLAVFTLPDMVRSRSSDTPAPSAYATEIAEVSEITLEDGSIVTLGAKSVIEAEFSETVRRVNLVSGEAFFNVAKDTGRPFFVAANGTLVRVVGTQFDVKSDGANVHVAVLEGVVEVIRPDRIPEALAAAPEFVAQAPRQMLTAGERLVSSKAMRKLPEAEVMQRAQAGAWRSGRLAYENASLAEIVGDLNRYHRRQVRIASAELKDLRLTATFKTTDLDEIIDMVEAIYPVTADESRPDRITLHKRAGEG